MNVIKIVLGIVVVAVIAIFSLAFLLPTSAEVKRSVIIQGEMDEVFTHVNSLKKVSKWSPWLARDRDTVFEYSGPDQGEGASMSWHSDKSDMGSGTQTIVASEKNRYVESALEFGEGGKGGGGLTRFDLAPVGDGVQVTWSFITEFDGNPVTRYFGLAMDSMLAPYFEQGLAELKNTVESKPLIHTEEISYSVDGTELNGYIAYPENATNAPGVLVVHEWWGHNEYVRHRADALAQLGYVALALDMYGEGKNTEHPKEANAFMMEVLNNADVAQARFTKALQVLKNHRASNSEKTAAVGYCFGGAVVLSMARAGADLDGVVSFHGSLGGLSPINEGEVKAEFLVLNGADDPFVTPEQVEAFKAQMGDANLTYEFINYPGVTHGFTNPRATEKGEAYGLPLKYDAQADEDSWARMQAFLKDVF